VAVKINPVVSRISAILLEQKEFIFLGILTCIFFFPVFIHPDQMIYPPGSIVGNDLTAQFSFWRSFFGTTLQNNQGIPFWNPYVFSGTPFIGNPQAELFSPFVWPFFIFNSDLLFGWLCILEIFLIGAFTFLFARSLNLSKYASLFSAVTFMFSGTVILRVYAGHLSILDTLVWFPLVLLFYERSFTHNRILSGLGAGIAMALMFLGGSFQIALYGIIVSCVYLIVRTFFFTTIPGIWDKIHHVVLVIFLSGILCIALSSIQVLPALEYSHLSNRDGGVSYSFSSAFSLPPSNLETILFPDVAGQSLGSDVPTIRNFPNSYWETALYLGILPLLFGAIAIIFRRNRYVWLFLGFALVSLLFSFGSYFPVYEWFFQVIPGFSMFRVPPRILFVFTFSLAIIAGFGIDTVFDQCTSIKNRFVLFFGRPVNRVICICIAAMFACVIAVSLFTATFEPKYILPSLFGEIAFIAAFCLAPAALNKNKPDTRQVNILKILLIALLVLDLFLFGMRFIDTKSPADVFRNPDFVPAIKNETDSYFRVYDETDLLNQNIAYRNNLYLVSGYDPTYLKDYQAYFIQSQSENYTGYYWWMQGAVIKDFDILRRLNVRYIVTTRKYDRDFSVPGLQCVYDNSSIRVYRLNATYPRAYLIPESEFGNATPASLQPAEIEQYLPDSVVVNVSAKDPAYLVLSEVYYPGWSARDNGRSADIVRYHEIFRAVHLDPGTHRVSFSYFPRILAPFG